MPTGQSLYYSFDVVDVVPKYDFEPLITAYFKGTHIVVGLKAYTTLCLQNPQHSEVGGHWGAAGAHTYGATVFEVVTSSIETVREMSACATKHS